jgi:hypothetical protein
VDADGAVLQAHEPFLEGEAVGDEDGLEALLEGDLEVVVAQDLDQRVPEARDL